MYNTYDEYPRSKLPNLFTKSRKTSLVYWLLGAFGFVAVFLGSFAVLSSSDGYLELYFLSVGQGDSQLIQLPSDIQIVIDGGPDGKKLLENLEAVMPANDRYIDLLIMTHPQLDHFGGFIELLKKYEVGAFVGTMRKGEIAAYDELRLQIEKRGVPYIQLMAGDSIAVGEARLRILSPNKSDILSSELNDTCIVALLDTPTLKALYLGDVDAHTEEDIVRRYGFTVDVLKVAHHGSRFSSSEYFLNKIKPKLAVIGVGKNTYGHPTKAALDRLEKSGAKVLRTDEQGIIKIVGGENLKAFGLR